MIEGKVADIIDEHSIVVNFGKEDGVQEHKEFIVYSMGEVIEDPDTGEALGNVEHVKAKVSPKHIQKSITVMESAETTTKKTGLYGITTSGTKQVPKKIAKNTGQEVDNQVKVGDLVRENISE